MASSATKATAHGTLEDFVSNAITDGAVKLQLRCSKTGGSLVAEFLTAKTPLEALVQKIADRADSDAHTLDSAASVPYVVIACDKDGEQIERFTYLVQRPSIDVNSALARAARGEVTDFSSVIATTFSRMAMHTEEVGNRAAMANVEAMAEQRLTFKASMEASAKITEGAMKLVGVLGDQLVKMTTQLEGANQKRFDAADQLIALATKSHEHDIQKIKLVAEEARASEMHKMLFTQWIPELTKQFMSRKFGVTLGGAAGATPPTNDSAAAHPTAAASSSPLSRETLGQVVGFLASLDQESFMRVYGVLTPEQREKLDAILEAMQADRERAEAAAAAAAPHAVNGHASTNGAA